MLKKFYVGGICPILEYGMAASSTAAKYMQLRLFVVLCFVLSLFVGNITFC